jgi:hypothetical protein
MGSISEAARYFSLDRMIRKLAKSVFETLPDPSAMLLVMLKSGGAELFSESEFSLRVQCVRDCEHLATKPSSLLPDLQILKTELFFHSLLLRAPRSMYPAQITSANDFSVFRKYQIPSQRNKATTVRERMKPVT